MNYMKKKQRAIPVSYTHLDVYKRQHLVYIIQPVAIKQIGMGTPFKKRLFARIP